MEKQQRVEKQQQMNNACKTKKQQGIWRAGHTTTCGAVSMYTTRVYRETIINAQEMLLRERRKLMFSERRKKGGGHKTTQLFEQPQGSSIHAQPPNPSFHMLLKRE